MVLINTEKYIAEAKEAMKDSNLQKALSSFQHRIGPATAATYQKLPEGPELRLKAHDMRMRAIENLDVLLEVLADNIHRRGGRVFFAATAKEAVDYCLQVAHQHRVKKIVKGKSMVTEEIGFNEALIAAGIEVTETDLGEYIIQLAREHPSHIIAPAIHKTRKDIGRLFADKLGIPYTDDPPTLTQAARKALRAKFMAADMGVSGCNLACAETGHITTVSNEGNIRMSTTLPQIHVAFMGMERVVASLEEHDILFRLLARGAAAQNMAGYVSYVGGPATSDQSDGPQEFHLIIIDNGRSRILADVEFREMLCCIRCAACLNVCPVYGKIGGHAYGFAYSGPVGAVVTPMLVGINRAKDLCQGETLCGACQDACPVNIDIPRMLLALRAKLADGDKDWNVVRNSLAEKAAFQFWAWVISKRARYDRFLQLGYLAQKWMPGADGMISRLPLALHGWTRSRDIKSVAKASFKKRWQNRQS